MRLKKILKSLFNKTSNYSQAGQDLFAVLQIGGLKEKLLAAHRAGVKKVLIPKENEKDLVDIPKKVREDIKIIPVETADEVLKIALTKELKPVEWTEVDKISEGKKDDKSQASIQ